MSAVRETVSAACDMRLENLTLFAFSSENWKRPKTEVGALMALFRAYFRSDMDELVERNVRMRIIGHRGRVADDIQQMIHDSESRTARNDGMNLTFALTMAGRKRLPPRRRNWRAPPRMAGWTPKPLPRNCSPRACLPARCRRPTW